MRFFNDKNLNNNKKILSNTEELWQLNKNNKHCIGRNMVTVTKITVLVSHFNCLTNEYYHRLFKEETQPGEKKRSEISRLVAFQFYHRLFKEGEKPGKAEVKFQAL